MNRYKKWLRSEKEVVLESDYPWLPFELPCSTLEGVSVKLYPHSIRVSEHYVSISIHTWYAAKTGKVCKRSFDC